MFNLAGGVVGLLGKKGCWCKNRNGMPTATRLALLYIVEHLVHLDIRGQYASIQKRSRGQAPANTLEHAILRPHGAEAGAVRMHCM